MKDAQISVVDRVYRRQSLGACCGRQKALGIVRTKNAAARSASFPLRACLPRSLFKKVSFVSGETDYPALLPIPPLVSRVWSTWGSNCNVFNTTSVRSSASEVVSRNWIMDV
jgi:hypothetical protein